MSIYEQHDKAFNNVSAFVITDLKGQRVATCAFKRGQAVTCFFHIIGLEMTKGRAGGGGYDRASAAAYDAVTKTKVLDGARPEERETLKHMIEACKEGNGFSQWYDALRKRGYNVLQAV